MNLASKTTLTNDGAMRRWIAVIGLIAGQFLGGTEASAASSSGAQRAESQEIDFVSVFAAPVLALTNGTSRLLVEGCETLPLPGGLSMPFRVVRLLLPPGYSLLRAQTKPVGELVSLKLSLQPPASSRASPHRNVAILRAASQPRWSAGHVEVASVQTLSGCDVAVLRVFPAGRGTHAGEVLFCSRLRISAVVEKVSARREVQIPRDPDQAARSVAAFVDNPDDISAHLRQWSRASNNQSTPETLPLRHGYLLITAARLVPAFEPLMIQKTRDGLAVRTETTESIAATFPGRDLPERIRNCIRHAFTNDGIRSVLLGGDVSIVPCRYAFVPRQLSEPECLVPTDLYYACLDGSWNRDEDQRWGESTDGDDGGEVDLLAEVEVGRAPVESEVEVRAFITKTARWADASLLRSNQILLLSTALEQGRAQGGTMFDPLLSLFQDSAMAWLDDRPGIAARWQRSDALTALNRSPRLVLYSGHGASDSLMRLSPPDLSALTNAVPFLLASVGCHAGEFDNPTLSPDCIGEQLLTCENGGAVAAILNSRAGWYEARDEIRYSGEYQSQLVRRLMNADGCRLGAVHQSAKQALCDRVEKSGPMPYRWCYYGLNLLGDPHLPVNFAESRRSLLGSKAIATNLPSGSGHSSR